ncbi:MAG TPA: hypothetical protein VN700_04870 [Vicinamibacterales bacterium]|nr:hypothetical protein [Vicinamibacterales bacterium]
MPIRPSRLWKDMPVENRVVAADAFWRDEQSDSGVQQVEAIVTIARRLNFRPKSVQALPLEKRAKHLAQMADVSDAVATRALIAYHFAAKRALMGAFLDALGISHEDGLIKEESVPPPAKDKIAAAITAVRGTFPAVDVDLYVRTLAALDGETWAEAESALAAS